MIYAKSILRKIKLSKLIEVKYSDKEKELITLFENKFRYLSSHMYGNRCVYTNVCNDFIFEANHYDKKIYVNKEFWDLIESKIKDNLSFDNYINTQKLFDYFIKQRYEHYLSFYTMPKY